MPRWAFQKIVTPLPELSLILSNACYSSGLRADNAWYQPSDNLDAWLVYPWQVWNTDPFMSVCLALGFLVFGKLKKALFPPVCVFFWPFEMFTNTVVPHRIVWIYSYDSSNHVFVSHFPLVMLSRNSSASAILYEFNMWSCKPIQEVQSTETP